MNMLTKFSRSLYYALGNTGNRTVKYHIYESFFLNLRYTLARERDLTTISLSSFTTIQDVLPRSLLIHSKSKILGYSISPNHQFFRSMFIKTQPTPNPDAMMFLPGCSIMGEKGVAEFASLRAAAHSPLARQLLSIDGVQAVFFGSDFVTVKKNDEVDWTLLKPEVFEILTQFLKSGEPIITENGVDLLHDDTRILPEDDDVVAMIKELIETRVRPAVAEDGGNIAYRGFNKSTGIVSLELQGACSSCSSSSITLKNGVENMLSHYIPEVKGVEEVKSEVQKTSDKVLSDLERKLTDSGILRS